MLLVPVLVPPRRLECRVVDRLRPSIRVSLAGLTHRSRATAIALIYPENIRSIRVAEKLGMEPEEEIEIFGNRVTRYSLGNRPAR